MGGYGSGRPRTRPSAEGSFALDMRVLQAKARPDGTPFDAVYRWGDSGITIMINPGQGIARLRYSANEQRIDERLGIVTLRGRWYWVCPCGQRALVLYRPSYCRHWRCRGCTRVVYRSSRASHQGISSLYRYVKQQHAAGQAIAEPSGRRLFWMFDVYDRIHKEQERAYKKIVGSGWRRRRSVQRCIRRAAAARWSNYRRRAARRAAKIDRYFAARSAQT